MEAKDLLDRMASISPGVHLHISGHMWKVNIDEDDLTQQMLVNECFAIMIREAYELGIEFFCTIQDLCESFVTIDHTLLLFEVLFPTPLYRSINESDAFKMMISAICLDGSSMADETSAVSVLEYLGLYNEDTTAVFEASFNFLQDKMKSNAMFEQYVASILAVSNTPMAVEVNPDIIAVYLQSVQTIYTELLRITDTLIHQAPPSLIEVLDTVSVYDSIEEYKTVAIEESTLEEYSWMHAAIQEQEPLPVTQALIEKYRSRFASAVPFHSEYFVLRKITELTNCDLVTLVLGSLLISGASNEAFVASVQTEFQTLKANGVVISDAQNSFTQQLTLFISREMYA